VGMSSYNFRQHVASDIGINQQYIPSGKIQSQQYMDNISEWTDSKQMLLNEKKTKIMIFNYTQNHQFSTRVYLKQTLLDIINETI
jgi:hypothetical protein